MDDLIKAMKIAFSSEFSYYLKAHFYHWNVEGADFSQYHKLFGKIYEEIIRFAERFSAIDKRNTQLTEDFRKLQISVDKITRRSERVKNLEFDKKTGIEK